MTSLYDFSVLNQDHQETPLETYRGKVLLVVNTATGCGLTPQYQGLQELYERYQEQGFEILDFPCNQFGAQAPAPSATFMPSVQALMGPLFHSSQRLMSMDATSHSSTLT